MADYDAIDLCAGPGGFDLAARLLGVRILGIESDDAAVATRRAAGLHTLQADIRSIDLEFVRGLVDWRNGGVVAGPPCQTFTVAAVGTPQGATGHASRSNLIKAILAGRTDDLDPELFDPRTLLVLEPLRWVLALRPAWVVFEQVQTVRPIWEAVAEVLRDEGYDVQVGNLRAEEFGVGQTRCRAILIASRDHLVAWPKPTHQRYRIGVDRIDQERHPNKLAPWVSLAQALDWTDVRREFDARLVDCSGFPADPTWPSRRPSTVIVSRGLIAHPGTNPPKAQWGVVQGKSRNDGLRVEPWEAGVVQTFPGDYPWRGTKAKIHEQIGNAIPPLLARAIIPAARGGY